MKATFRTNVFRQAWELVRATGKTFAVCLAKAWNLYRLASEMKNGPVKFSYEKVDRSLRKAIGTLKDLNYTAKGKESSSKVFNYFDIEANSFRSFRIENLITIY